MREITTAFVRIPKPTGQVGYISSPRRPQRGGGKRWVLDRYVGTSFNWASIFFPPVKPLPQSEVVLPDEGKPLLDLGSLLRFQSELVLVDEFNVNNYTIVK